ncbi:MAG: PocR ligand-binding domain-containing protein [Lachnospiraceae bacterium]|nr:PocR ligand-binding domain-containing protein [Lachnospiraceae bacterium]
MINFLLSDLIPADILQELQDAFSEYSGMAALITDANGMPVTVGSGFSRFCMELTRKSEKGNKNCELCDRQGALLTLQNGGKPAVYTCHAGLVDYAAPILLNGEFVGSFIGGQVRSGEVNEEEFWKTAIEYGLDPDAYIEAARETRCLPKEDIERTALFLSKMAGVLSKIAYQRYLVFQQNQNIEDTARTQSEFLTQFADDMQQSVKELFLYLSDAGDEQATDHIQKNVDMLLARTMKLGSIVEDSVDYVNIINGIFDLNESVYDIRKIAELKVSEYLTKANEKNNTVEFRVDDNVPLLFMGDSGRVGTIIGKLIENAIRFTDNGKIHLVIEKEELSYSCILVIRVMDNGVGIEEKQLEYIKNYMSSRGFSDTKDEEFEMLGFSAVGYCINALSGSLDIKSRLGVGTEFIVRIPQLAVEEGGQA